MSIGEGNMQVIQFSYCYKDKTLQYNKTKKIIHHWSLLKVAHKIGHLSPIGKFNLKNRKKTLNEELEIV
jgi:hypothetical protein